MTAVLECLDLKKYFLLKGRGQLHAVDDVSFSVAKGESVGLVGESGCGKSTLARVITRTLDPSAGDIVFDGHNIGAIPARSFARTAWRSRIQMVFQDAADSLDPRYSAFATIAEPLQRLEDIADSKEIASRVSEAARQVGLPEALLARLPHQLSGGQKARVGIARAIVTRPQLLVLDEPTAALDVSVQATVLKLLAGLQRELSLSYLFVSHDLNVVRMLCDRVIVMYLGRIVEQAPTERLFRSPAHPYTRALLRAIPVLGGQSGERTVLAGEPRSPVDPDPSVCRFFGRCPRQVDRCRTEAPVLRDVGPAQQAACHFVEELHMNFAQVRH
jgi:oligopeptide/dipeptide ABC transporter ATP-binding protein